MKVTITNIGKRAGLVLLGMVVASSLSLALPVCSAGGTVSGLGATGCTFGGVDFTNFSITPGIAIGGISAAALSPTNIHINFSSGGDNIFVDVSNDTPAAWSLTGAQQFSFQLNYTVTAPGAWFDVFAVSLAGSTTGNGAISLSKGIDNSQFLNVNQAVLNAGPAAFNGGPLATFVVADNFVVAASGGTATLTNGTNSFHTPEPMSSMLLGSGLLAMGYFLRRRRS